MKILVVVLILMLNINYSVYSHPGKTDGNGGHYCRTNCESYGLSYGEYHYPSSNGSSSKTVYISDDNDSDWFTYVFWAGVLSFIIYGFYSHYRDKRSYVRREANLMQKGVRTVAEIIETRVPIPEDQDVEFSGHVTNTIFRKNGLFVARFITTEDVNHTIVGFYNDRLYKNKLYRITGILTYNRRYGMQVRVKTIDRVHSIS